MPSMSPDQPHSYPRRILLAVTGLSPQVTTETLFALCRQTPAFIPTEIHLITTREGAERARLSLFSEEPGWFHRLRRDYTLPEIQFNADHIHVPCDAQGMLLADIRSPADNEIVADFITDTVRKFSADANAALHVSISGGRKTMGFYLGYALSLYGRAQDRLSHVLVSEPFESSWDFFYPTPYSRVISTRDNKLADTASAEVTLAEIPFVSLRHGLPDLLLNGTARYSDAVASAQHRLGPPELLLDLHQRRIIASDQSITLTPVYLAFMAWFAWRAQQQLPALKCPPDGAPETGYAAEYLKVYSAIPDRKEGGYERVAQRLAKGMDKNTFQELKSRLNKTLRTALGKDNPYLITAQGRRPQDFLLALPAQVIRFNPSVEEILNSGNTDTQRS